MSVNTVIVGCGNIADTYARDLSRYAEIQLKGFFDLDANRASALSERFGGRVYGSLYEVLKDQAVQLVINLTIHHAHESIIEQCLLAGKHVHTEKPLALSYASARRLQELSEKTGLRLSSAPITWMGEAQQAFVQQLNQSKIGTVRLVYAEINHGRIETWHPNPAPFYDVGVVWDVGIYPITFLTAVLGPVRSVSALNRYLIRDRLDQEQRPFTINRPDFVVAMLDFACGATARLSCNFYTTSSKQGSSVEFHGDNGTLRLSSSYLFNANLEACEYGKELEPIANQPNGFNGIEFARGAQELARAIIENRPHPSTASHATHVIEIMEAIDRSAGAENTQHTLVSTFPPPPPLSFQKI